MAFIWAQWIQLQSLLCTRWTNSQLIKSLQHWWQRCVAFGDHEERTNSILLYARLRTYQTTPVLPCCFCVMCVWRLLTVFYCTVAKSGSRRRIFDREDFHTNSMHSTRSKTGRVFVCKNSWIIHQIQHGTHTVTLGGRVFNDVHRLGSNGATVSLRTGLFQPSAELTESPGQGERSAGRPSGQSNGELRLIAAESVFYLSLQLCSLFWSFHPSFPFFLSPFFNFPFAAFSSEVVWKQRSSISTHKLGRCRFGW